MDNLAKSMNSIMEIALRCKDKAPKAVYKCEVCRDTGFEVIAQVHSAPIIRECKCRKADLVKEQWINSGFNIAAATKSFKSFKIVNTASEKMRNMSLEYVRDFEGIQFQNNNGIALLGQPGVGKTHICMAVCLELLKKNFYPRYFPYREEISALKQLVTNGMEYQERINRFKKSGILFIDDLFKGGANESDIRIMFEILNHRYINKLVTIISSEFISSELLKIDEALGSRIIEMCKGRTLDLYGPELNYRLKREQ